MSGIWWSLALRPLKTKPLSYPVSTYSLWGLLRRANNQLLDGLGELLLQLGSSGEIKFSCFPWFYWIQKEIVLAL